jgi:hypothetical protein
VPIDAVTVAVAPAASEPLVDDSVTHVCVFAADQLIDAPPVFVSVYSTLDGLNGPPTVPEDVSPVAGATDIAPAVAAGWSFASPGKNRALISTMFVNVSPSESTGSKAVSSVLLTCPDDNHRVRSAEP